MTRLEQQILGPVINMIARSDEDRWESLKHETEHGPFFGTFPYHPSAINFQEEAESAINALSNDQKSELLRLWRDKRDKDIAAGQILVRYAMMIVENIVDRAKAAQGRTIYY